MVIRNIIQKAEQEYPPVGGGQLNTGDISNLQTQIDNRVTNLGAASGIQVMTTGAYNSGTPLSGVVYILI
jgi:hypothetical protein